MQCSILVCCNLYTTSLFKNPSFPIKNKEALQQNAKGFGNGQAPLTFSSWNQIIQDMRNIYKLKELISPPVSAISPV